MSGRTELHRPLLSGVRITSRIGNPLSHTHVGGGTLTGLAVRNSDKKRMLVTNLHVMAGLTDQDHIQNPTGSEKMFQGGDSYAHKVGSTIRWSRITLGPGKPNEADIAMCFLDSGIDPWGDDELGAVFKLHDSSHSSRTIIRGTKEPEPGLPVILLGGVTGEIRGEIFDISREKEYIGGAYFKNLFRVGLRTATKPGNSGSPILYKVEDGVYQMVGIHFAIEEDPHFGYAFPASTAERLMRIKFGHQPPVANAGPDQKVYLNSEVTLDGRLSTDPDNRGLTYRWEQDFGSDRGAIAEIGVDLSDNTAVQPTFTAPKEPRVLKFNLTVTDVDGLSHTDSVKITVENRPPVADAGENRQEDTGVTVTLDGSNSTPVEGLTYSWVVDEPTHGITLVGANTARPYFTSPVEDVDVTFTLTVTDGIDRTATASVTLQFRDTWSDWQDVEPIQHQGEGHEREKQQFSTSDLGKTKYRWEPDPEEIWPDEWTNTDVYKNEDGKRWRKQVRISNLGNEHPDPNWLDLGALDWGDWEFVRHEGSGASRVRVEQRTTQYPTYNTSETRELPDPVQPPTPPWNEWEWTDNYKNENDRRWRQRRRISNVGLPAEEEWVDQGPLQWGDWEFVRHEGSGASRVQVEQRTTTYASHNTTETREVPDPVSPPQIWSAWVNVSPAEYRLTSDGEEVEALQKRHKLADSTMTQQMWNHHRFVADGEEWTEDWSGTNHYRGQGASRERLWQRFSNLGNPITEWRSAPPPPPASPSADAGSNQSVDYGERVDLNGIGSTPVGKLRFSWSESSSHGIILESADTAYPYFTAPETYAVITVQLTVTHTESNETTTDSVTITVGSPPPPASPSADAGSNQSVDYGERVDLDGIGSTPVGKLSFSWSESSSHGIILESADTAYPYFTAPETYAVITVQLTVTHTESSETATDSVTITVGSPPPPPPVSPSADAGSNQSVDYGERVDLDGIGSTPVGKLRFSWSESSSHGIILESADTAYPYFTAPETYAVITVQLTVTHTESSETATDSVTITVGSPPPPPPPPAPTADAGSDQSVGGNVTVTLDGSGSSGGTGTLSYSWAETTGHNISLTGADTASPSFTSPGSAAIVAVQLTVTDSAGRTATDSVTITVTAPPPPPPPGEWSDWASTGVYKNENGRRWRQEMRHDIDDLSITEERWVDIGALSWGEWTFVRYEGSGASRMRVEQRATTYSSHNTTETREVPDPEEIWGPWTPTGNHQGCGPDRQAEQSRTSNYQNTETRFVADPEPKTWSEWMDTGEDRGCGSGREAEQSRISHCGDSETRWVSSPEALRWSNWSNTGSYRGCGPDREVRQSRTSQCGDTQTQWVDSPEALRWSNWGNTGSYRGCGPDREARQSRTSQCGDTQTRWADSPVPEEFGDWTDAGETRGATPCVQEKKQTRTGDCGTVQTRWVDDPQPEIWGEWEDTGEVSGILDARSKKQKRTSDCNNIEYQWVPVITEWGSWERTGDYQGCGPNRKAKEERISNFGDVDVQWVPAPVPEVFGDWTDAGETRGATPCVQEKKQTRTGDCGTVRTRWVDDPQPEKWGNWIDTGEYRENPDTFITEYEQKRTSNCGNVEYRWSE